MELKEIIDNKFHGLPGLGVNLPAGDKGMKGKSIYVGYLRSFFDGIYTTEREMGYIRIKGEDEQLDSREPDFYYRSDGNFYRKIVGIDGTMEQMMKFTIYNLKGVYYNNTPTNSTKSETWNSLATNDLAFINRKANIGDALDYRYESIGKTEKIADIAFPVKLSEDYLSERDYNNNRTNASNNLTPDLFLPTTLKKMYHEGDILYIQDDITGNVVCFVVLTSELVGCTFERMLQEEFVSIEMVSSTFKDMRGRAVLNKKMYVPILDLDERIATINYGMQFQKNFIQNNKNNFNLSLIYNNDEPHPFLRLITGQKEDILLLTKSGEPIEDSNGEFISLSKSGDISVFDINYAPTTEINDFEIEDAFVFSGDNMKCSNLFIKNIDTNINIAEYNNDNLKLEDDFHIRPVSSKTLDTERDGISFKIFRKDYFKTFREDQFYGLTVYQKKNGWFQKIFNELSNIKDEISFRITPDMCEEEENEFSMVAYVQGIGISKYWSIPSELHLTCAEEDGEKVIAESDFNQSDFQESVNSFDSGKFEIISSSLTCEENDNFSIVISSLDENVHIKDVYLNNVPLVLNGEALAENDLNSWLKFDAKTECRIDEEQKRVEFTGLFVESNIPNIKDGGGDVQYPQTMKEYFHYISESAKRYQIATPMNKTSDREIVLVVIGQDDIHQNIRSSYIIVQSGVEDVLPDVSVNFRQILDENRIEDCNKSEKGILCNQFQYFTEMKMNNFTEMTWGRYFDKPKVSVKLELDKTVQVSTNNYQYIKDTNLSNVQIYAQKDKDLFLNNAVKVDFSWIGSDVDYKSSTTELNSKENVIDAYPSLSDTKNTPLETVGGWVAFDDKLNRKATTIPYGINYNITSSVDDLNFDETVRIRTKGEVANPIPMEFNFKWKVAEIMVYGQLRDEYDDSEEKEMFYFIKDLSETNIYSEELLTSENTKFIINPITLTLCPEDMEEQSDIRGSIKKVGSEDGIKISLSIQKIAQESVDEFNENHFYDVYSRQDYLKNFQNGLGFGVSDITFYQPKIKYLQDNITNIVIKSKKVDFTDGEFGKMLQKMKEDESFFRNSYNLYCPSSETYTNYINLFYDSKVMLPQNRGGKMTFYYNDKTYDADVYDQWYKASPLWSKFDITYPVLDTSLIMSKQIWNIEYEVSPEYNKKLVSGGVLTKSGNGYLNLNSDYDYGQYEIDKLFGLEATKTKVEDKILTDTMVVDLIEPEGFVVQPKKNEFYRALVKKSEWVYPNYYKSDGEINIVPYYPVNSYESYIDTKLMQEFIDDSKQGGNLEMKDIKSFIKDSGISLVGNEQGFQKYLDRKFDDKFYIKTGQGLELTSSMEKINMLIPYNLMFDVFPRTAYNIDMGMNTINIFMVQQPNVNRVGNYKFDKTYFEDDHLDIISPWQFNK